MKSFIFIGLFSFAHELYAVDSQQFCDFLLNRAQIDPKSQLTSKDAKAQLDELMAIMAKANGFLELAKQGVTQKMSWEKFKKFASDKGVILANFYQPQYDGMYMRQYCGEAKTEASVKIENGVTTQRLSNTRFTLKPVPSEHEYSTQIKGVK